MASVRRSTRSASYALSTLAEIVRTGSSVVFITGAGISVASGITPFRSSPSAVWSSRTVEFGTKSSFSRDPLRWYNDFWLAGVIPWDAFYSAQPNAAHVALADIARRFPSVRCVTQNIDKLHSISPGTIPRPQFISAHGTADLYRCELEDRAGTSSLCASRDVPVNLWSFASPEHQMRTGSRPPLPRKLARLPICTACNRGRLRPACLMFDEDYDPEMWAVYEQWLDTCSAIVFIGSSNAVGLTAYAMSKAVLNGTPIFNFNLTRSSSFPKDAVAVYHVIGPAAKTVPELRDLIAAEQDEHKTSSTA
jgi:NAD-dependent deacetylase